MKVCMVAYTYYEADNRVRRYAELLAKRGDTVDVVALRQMGQSRYEELKGVRVHRIQTRVLNEKQPITYLGKLLLFLFRSAVFLTSKSLNAKYDLVHVHSVPDFEVFAALVPKLMGAKIILDIHDIVPEFYASKFNNNRDSLIFKLLVLIEKMSIAFSDHVIIANHIWHKTLTTRSVDKDKCSVILNYPDLDIFKKIGRSRNDNKFLMVYPGSLNWHQGIDIAIRSFSMIAQKYPFVEFHIYGDGKEKRPLMNLTSELKLEGRVHFNGIVPLEEIASVMANSDLGVVPKRAVSFGNEAFSTKIFEFMAMGVPVLASSTKIDKHYFDDSQIMFFQSENVVDLACKMETLIRDPQLRRHLVANSDRYIQDNIWDIKSKEYLDIIHGFSVKNRA